MRFLPILAVIIPILAADEIPLRSSDPPAQDTFVEHGTPGAPDRWITRVGRASLTVYPAAKERATGTGILVVPGGGYQNLVIDAEGHDVGRWLSSIGVTAFVLKYRLPLPPGPLTKAPADTKSAIELFHVAIEDARLALEIAHRDAARWRVNSDSIGMMGFSAGGHLVSIVGNEPGPARPAFLALLYPTIEPDIELTADSPRVFLAAADNDRLAVPENGVLRYYQAARKAGVRAEMHLFISGGHGFAVRKTRSTATSFPSLFENWIAGNPFLH